MSGEPNNASGNQRKTDARKKDVSPSRLILAVSAGLLADARLRRRMMIGLLLAATAMVFAGAVLLDEALAGRPLLFLGYWAACAALTCFTILLAVFDMLMVRRHARLMRRNLMKSVFGDNPEEKP